MSEFRYDKPVVKKVHILGNSYECREPSLEEQQQYEKNLKEVSTSDAAQVIYDHLELLGIPQETSKKLPQSQILKLLKWFSLEEDDSKKK